MPALFGGTAQAAMVVFPAGGTEITFCDLFHQPFFFQSNSTDRIWFYLILTCRPPLQRSKFMESGQSP
jgi:hypothetical protein